MEAPSTLRGTQDPQELGQPAPGPAVPLNKPWPLTSQLWVALIGGALPYAIIAYLNAERLELPRSHRITLVVLAAITLLLAGLLSVHGVQTLGLELPRQKIWLTQAGLRTTGLGLFCLVSLLHLPASRLYGKKVGIYGHLWSPGLIATAIFSPVQGLIIGALVVLLTR